MQKPKWNIDLKKVYDDVTQFLKPYGNLKNPLVTQKLAGFLRNHINGIYVAGLIVLGLFTIGSLFKLPCIMSMLADWAAIFVVFVVFRMLCELLAEGSRRPAQKTEEVKVLTSSEPTKKVLKKKK